MARTFDDASTQYLRLDSNPVGQIDFTLAGWGFTDDLTAIQTVVSLGDLSASVQFASLRILGTVANDPVEAVIRDASSTEAKAVVSSVVTVNTWHHYSAVFTSTSSRTVSLDGTASTNTTAISSLTGLDSTGVGVLYRVGGASNTQYWSGRLAEIGIWSAALTTAEIAILAAGYSPLFVRPESLAVYLPLVRDADQDIVGGNSFTAVNAPGIAPHPPIIYPAPPMIGHNSTAVPGSGRIMSSLAASGGLAARGGIAGAGGGLAG